MWFFYYWRDILFSNWADIGVNDSLRKHTINIGQWMLELAPLDLIIDLGMTMYLVIGLIVFYIVVVRNFMKGYRGE